MADGSYLYYSKLKPSISVFYVYFKKCVFLESKVYASVLWDSCADIKHFFNHFSLLEICNKHSKLSPMLNKLDLPIHFHPTATINDSVMFVFFVFKALILLRRTLHDSRFVRKLPFWELWGCVETHFLYLECSDSPLSQFMTLINEANSEKRKPRYKVKTTVIYIFHELLCKNFLELMILLSFHEYAASENCIFLGTWTFPVIQKTNKRATLRIFFIIRNVDSQHAESVVWYFYKSIY